MREKRDAPMTLSAADVNALLPLQPFTFHVLLSLTGGDRHGYGIMQDVEARTDGAVRLSAGALYRTIARLQEQGLIVEPRKPNAPRGDPRRRYYRLTPFGRAVSQAETNRLAQLVRLARGSGLVPEAS
jgi:DNA-binding PadR family transcriptional regulator